MAKQKTKNKEAKQRISKVLDEALNKFETDFSDSKVKPSMGDYLKLMQIKQEIDQEDEDAKEIEVKWVDPETTKSEDSE